MSQIFNEGGFNDNSTFSIGEYKLGSGYKPCRHCKDGKCRRVVTAWNQGGHDCTSVCVDCIIEAANPTEPATDQTILNQAIDKLTKLTELPESAELARAVLDELGGYKTLAKEWRELYKSDSLTAAGQSRMLDQLVEWIEKAKAEEESSERYTHMTKAQLLAKLKEFPFIEEYLEHRDKFKLWLEAGMPGVVTSEQGKAQPPAAEDALRETDRDTERPDSQPGDAVP